MSKEKIITDEQIELVWGNANFGNLSKRDVIDTAVLKCASGYWEGHTAQCIVKELGLVNKKNWSLTKLGKKYLYEAFRIEKKLLDASQ